MITRLGTSKDINGVLALQVLNLQANLPITTLENGFVTTPFTPTLIEQIIQMDGLFVAEDKGQIIAYVYAGSWAYFQQWPIFDFMIARFPSLQFNKQLITVENSFQYGPICIATDYRGKGVLQKIFEEMRIAFASKYSISITFINAINKRSTKAHVEKLGWEIIDKFTFNNNQYLGLAYNMEVPILG